MLEVEKLFELTGIEKSKCWDNCTTCTRTSCVKNISYIKAEYPPFTVEKQLELIKWLGKSRPIHITFLCDEWNIEGMVRYGKRYNTFENALCGYTTMIWQDLTEIDRNEIRDILKG